MSIVYDFMHYVLNDVLYKVKVMLLLTNAGCKFKYEYEMELKFVFALRVVYEKNLSPHKLNKKLYADRG